ncbi:MAG: glycosyltransferase family 87 protein [Candidatus Thorarchaeota archaeon]
MAENKYLRKVYRRLRELWEYDIFRYALLIQFFYLILSLILTLIFLRGMNDFLVYYEVGKVFITDINNLYNRANYLWPFRYLPISAILFVPFYLLGFNLGFIFFNILNLFLNVLISIFLYKVIIYVRRKDHEEDDKRIILYISLFLIGLPNLFNYILGQINLYVTFLILLSLYLFVTRGNLKSDFLSSFILGFSILIKPITIFMIPFLLILRIDYKAKKVKFDFVRSLVRIVGVILPISLNLFLFLIYPSLWDGFLTINFTGDEPIILNHSFSLTKLVLNFFIFFNISINSLLIFLLIIIIIGGLGFLIYIFRKQDDNSITLAYTFGFLIMLLVYFDSWTHHLLALTPLLIVLIFCMPRNSEITRKYLKPSFFFLNFFDLAFMGIWFIIQNWFPFNFITTIFLLIIFYGLSKYTLSKDLNVQLDDPLS